MSTDIGEIIENFQFLEDWDDRYRYVIELGKSLPPFSDEHRTAANKVNGCVSQVWVSSTIGSGNDPEITFIGDSDAHIVRGLVAIMLVAMSGKTASQILELDVEALLSELGLDEHISPQRANGLRAMVARMRADALAANNQQAHQGHSGR